jgi:hypothetical protein
MLDFHDSEYRFNKVFNKVQKFAWRLKSRLSIQSPPTRTGKPFNPRRRVSFL